MQHPLRRQKSLKSVLRRGRYILSLLWFFSSFFSVAPRVYPRTRRKASTKNFLSFQRTSISLIAACYASPLYTLYVEILISRVEDIDACRSDRIRGICGEAYSAYRMACSERHFVSANFFKSTGYGTWPAGIRSPTFISISAVRFYLSRDPANERVFPLRVD